jgi:Domain of unknown function (DUF4413)
MGTEIFAKWDKYWTGGKTLLAIAYVLDPRCKLAVVEYYIEKIYADECPWFVANLKTYMNELFKEYAEAHSKLVQNQLGNSAQRFRYNTK